MRVLGRRTISQDERMFGGLRVFRFFTENAFSSPSENSGVSCSLQDNAVLQKQVPSRSGEAALAVCKYYEQIFAFFGSRLTLPKLAALKRPLLVVQQRPPGKIASAIRSERTKSSIGFPPGFPDLEIFETRSIVALSSRNEASSKFRFNAVEIVKSFNRSRPIKVKFTVIVYAH